MNNLEQATNALNSSDFTCVIVSEENTITSNKKGVAPLLELLEQGYNLKDYSAADKVVGNGAAFLYVLLEIKELYAKVISKVAYNTLLKYGISVTYGEQVEAIRNRDNTGFCPIETAVIGASNPKEALIKIKEKLNSMK